MSRTVHHTPLLALKVKQENFALSRGDTLAAVIAQASTVPEVKLLPPQNANSSRLDVH